MSRPPTPRDARPSEAGVAVDGIKDARIGGNSITGDLSCAQGADCGERAVLVTNGSGIIVADNSFVHNSYGVLITAGSSGSNRNKFDKNTEIEFYVENLSKCTLRGNRIEYSGYVPGNSAIGVDGFGMRESADVVIDRNFVSSHYYGMKVYSSTRVTFSNNVSDESGVPVRFGHANGDQPEPAGPEILVRNNRVTDGLTTSGFSSRKASRSNATRSIARQTSRRTGPCATVSTWRAVAPTS